MEKNRDIWTFQRHRRTENIDKQGIEDSLKNKNNERTGPGWWQDGE
jgi:hypothetical protein